MAEKKEMIPVDLVQRLAAHGKSEPQIIAELRSHGFTPVQISKAIKEAMKAEVSRPDELIHGPASRPSTPGSARPMPVEVHPKPMEVYPKHIEEKRHEMPIPAEIMPKEHKISMPESKKQHDISLEPPAEKPMPISAVPKASVEELVEAVVQEKWNETRSRIDDFGKRVDRFENAMDQMKKGLSVVSTEEAGEEKRFSSQIDSLRSDLDKIDSRLAAIERAFKEFSGMMRRK